MRWPLSVQERWEKEDAEYYVHSSGKAAQAGDAKAVHVTAVSTAGAGGPNGADEDLEVNAATNTNIKVTLGALAAFFADSADLELLSSSFGYSQ